MCEWECISAYASLNFRAINAALSLTLRSSSFTLSARRALSHTASSHSARRALSLSLSVCLCICSRVQYLDWMRMNDALKFCNAFWLCICVCVCVCVFVVSSRVVTSACACMRVRVCVSFECAQRPSRHVCPCCRQSALHCESECKCERACVCVCVRVRVSFM